MRPRRPYPIVFLLTSFDAGGTERQMLELIRRLDRNLFSVHLACFHNRGVLKDRASERVTPIVEFPLRSFRRPSALLHLTAFARWCRRVDARIVHTCDFYANVLGLPGAALAGVPVRIGNRREIVTGDKSAAQLACQHLAYRTAHAIVANSAAAAEQLRREGVPPRKIQTIPNGIEIASFVPRADRPPQIRRIAMVANLRPEKGHEILIDAAAQIVSRYPDVEFDLIGDGPLRAVLARQAHARGVGSQIRFLGHRDDVPALLAASDLFVLPSRSEASPNALLEAMAAGLPVVASDVGGIPELIEPGVTGMLVDPGDPAGLARAILDLMNRPDDAWALGRAARAHVQRRYSFDRMVSSFEALYVAELERQQPSARPARELAAS